MSTNANQATDQIPLIAGKWYVLDMFATDGRPTCGPFETHVQAEAERVQINIAEDCFLARFNGTKNERPEGSPRWAVLGVDVQS